MPTAHTATTATVKVQNPRQTTALVRRTIPPGHEASKRRAALTSTMQLLSCRVKSAVTYNSVTNWRSTSRFTTLIPPSKLEAEGRGQGFPSQQFCP